MPTYDQKHRANVLRYAKQMDEAFESVTMQLGRLVSNKNIERFKGSFSFDTHPFLEGEAKVIFGEFNSEVESILRKGIADEWDLSNTKNDALVKQYLNTSALKAAPYLLERNISALNAFANREVNGIGLSDRVWYIKDGLQKELEAHVGIGIATGKSSDEISRRIRQYIGNPEALFRRVKDEKGRLVLSKAAKEYHPGQGTYRSAYKNARRLAVTETNMAYRLADHDRWQNLDFIVGYEVKRTSDHSKCSVCEAFQGRYPKTFKFTGWHPHCMCIAVPIRLSDEEFSDYQDALLAGKKYDAKQSKNYVSDVPAGYKKWIKDNTDRMKGWKTKPYFIKDNYRWGALDKGLKPDLAAFENKSYEKETTSFLHDLGKDRKVTRFDSKRLLNKFANDFPNLIKGQFRGLEYTKASGYLMQNTRYSSVDSLGTRRIVGNKISISNHTFKLNNGETFNPGQEFIDALQAIKTNNRLTFNQEYALESLWHEIRHAGAIGNKVKFKKSDSRLISMETINQFCARHSYDEFISKIGGTAQNKIRILEDGYGYRYSVSNFRDILHRHKIDETETYKHFKDIIQNRYYETIQKEIIKYLKGKGVKNPYYLLQNINAKPKDFVKLLTGD